MTEVRYRQARSETGRRIYVNKVGDRTHVPDEYLDGNTWSS